MSDSENSGRERPLTAEALEKKVPEGWVVENETGGLHADNRRAVDGLATTGIRISWSRSRFYATRLEPANLRDYRWEERIREFDTLDEAIEWALRHLNTDSSQLRGSTE